MPETQASRIRRRHHRPRRSCERSLTSRDPRLPYLSPSHTAARPRPLHSSLHRSGRLDRPRAELGDHNRTELLRRHRELTRRELSNHRGREVNTTGHGFLATFDGPARAIHCAQAISDRIHALGLEIRAGLHTGECELMGQDVGGIAVHIAARVAALADPGEVLVSSTVKDLVAGSGIRFIERGTYALKGVPDEWRLYAVEA